MFQWLPGSGGGWNLQESIMKELYEETEMFLFHDPHDIYTGVCFPGGSDSKESACNAGDPGLMPGLERSPGEGNGNPLQYPCLENSMDRGTWRAYSPWGTKSQK